MPISPNAAASTAPCRVLLACAERLAGPKRGVALLGAHRRLDGEVPRPGRNPPGNQPGRDHRITRDPRIHDPQLHAIRPREHVRSRSAGKEVRDHLARHRLRVGGDPFGSNPVVAREEGQAAATKTGAERALNPGDPRREPLHVPKGTRRLRLPINRVPNFPVQRVRDGS